MDKSQRQTVQDHRSVCEPGPWRVFYTRSRVEMKVEDVLKRGEIEVFLPKRVVTRQWSDRKRRVVLALFPGYIFARVNERDRLRVLQTDGVVRAICFNGKLAIVPEPEIEVLQSLQKDPERLEAIRLPLPTIGAPVVINQGPFQGLHGEVIEHRRRIFVVIRLHSICQVVKIEIPVDWATRVSR